MLAAIVSVLILVTFKRKASHIFFNYYFCELQSHTISSPILYSVCVYIVCVQCWTLFCYELFFFFYFLSHSVRFYVLLILCLSYHNGTEYKNNCVLPFINIQMRVIDWCLNGHNPLPLNAPPIVNIFILIFSVCFLMCTKRPPFLLLLSPATNSNSDLFLLAHFSQLVILKRSDDIWFTIFLAPFVELLQNNIVMFGQHSSPAATNRPVHSVLFLRFLNYFSVLLVIVLSHTALILSMCVSVFYIHSLDSSNQLHFSLQLINFFRRSVCNIHRYF